MVEGERGIKEQEGSVEWGMTGQDREESLRRDN